MDFYRMLAENYDEVFPFSEKTASLINEITPSGGNILDIGSASGQYVKYLRSKGYNAFGLEYSPEIIRYKEATVNGDMTFLPFKNVFDTVICTGNTLAHVSHYPHAVMVMRNISNAIRDKGKAIIQILNYEKILTEHPSALPEIKTNSLRFERHYQYDEDSIRFTGTLSNKSGKAQSTVKLYPITPKELLELGFKSGFRTIEFFGDYDKSGFDIEDSFMLIALMSK